MTSAIDPTVPVAGNPTTLSVRTNFATAAAEITALQSGTVTAVTGTTGQISSTGGQTPALSFPASMDLTGVTVANAAITSGTLNGVVIGGSSPAAGTFTTGAFSGNVTITTQSPGDSSTKAASTAFVATSFAPLASPTLTGTPAASTAAVDTNTTQIATTAFVLAQASAATPIIDGSATIGTSTRFARADHIHPTDTTRAALSSPTLSGTPAAPTAAAGTNTTQIATTAFCRTEFAAPPAIGNTTPAAGSFTALTVTTSGATITGNSTITGTLGSLTGLTVASGGASVTGTSTMTGDVNPGANATYNLGGTSTRWLGCYANLFGTSLSTALTAAGATQGTALSLSAAVNVVSTTAAGTGVILQTAPSTISREIIVINRGANTLNVYPATGAQIDALGANVATTVATNAKVRLVSASSTQWYIV